MPVPTNGNHTATAASSSTSNAGAAPTTEPPAPVVSLELKTTERSSPGDCWETVFVMGFIMRFCELKGQVEAFETVLDLERELLAKGPSPVLHAILVKFIDNLRPKRNTSIKQISATLYTVICELCNSNERSVWWNFTRGKNVVPFPSDMDIFEMEWDQKLAILRQLVEWQLSKNAVVRNLLDRAHGVVRGGHRKRADDAPRPVLIPPDPEHTKEKLQLIPIGQDYKRQRYWVVDDSPRLYISGNPWKTSCPFHAITSTREEYMAVVAALKSSRPPSRSPKKRSKVEMQHDELIAKLEGPQLDKIDAELKRLEAVEKKVRERSKAREALAAQSEIRESRTRVKVNKPDYVYDPGSDRDQGIIYDDGEEIDELDDEEYLDEPPTRDSPEAVAFEREYGEDEEFLQDELEDSDSKPSRAARSNKGKAKAETTSSANGSGTRRSGRVSTKRSYAEVPSPPRGERRSTRRRSTVGGRSAVEGDDERPAKRARMSSVGSSHTNGSVAQSASAGVAALSINGAKEGANGVGGDRRSALKSGEKATDTITGKKKSKFWYYVVEPMPDSSQAGSPAPTGDAGTATTPATEISQSAAMETDYHTEESKDGVPITDENKPLPVKVPNGSSEQNNVNHSMVNGNGPLNGKEEGDH